MATNVNSLTPAQQSVVNQIISKGQQLGASTDVIEALVCMANAESDFNPNAANGTTTATGLFQYINSTWASSWASYVNANPNSPLAQMSASECK